MAIEGELVLRIATHEGRVTRAEAAAARPRVARLLAGRAPGDAAPLVRTLFAICGRSQAVAAQAAVAASRGEPARESLRAARETRVAAEMAQEHAWRLLVDLPTLAGHKPELEAVAMGRARLAPLLDAEEGVNIAKSADEARAWVEGALFGVPPGDILAFDTVERLRAWALSGSTPTASLCATCLAGDPGLGASSVELLSPGADEWIAGDLAPALDSDDAFERAPHRNGEPRETGPLSRNAAHPLVADALRQWGRGEGARLVARLVEMAAVMQSLGKPGATRHGATAVPQGGISWVETARGLLVHRIAIDAGRIALYRIVAPTEWNFHPQGAFSRGALGLKEDDPPALEHRVRRLAASLDPCVAVRYEACHA